MANHYITTNQTSLNTAKGDNTFVAFGVTINGGIDMRGVGIANGGEQTVNLNGTLFGSLNDYYTATSGRNQVFIGETGSINHYWSSAIQMGGGGHTIINAGTISSMQYGTAMYLLGTVGAYQTERITLTNTGTISSISLHPERTWADATIYASSSVGTTLTNTGTILSSIGYAVTLYSAEDIVTNHGLIQGGVRLGDGNDWFDSRQGFVTGMVLGDGGNDILYGGKGDDNLVGGADNDRIDGSIGADLMVGGTGDDTYFVDNSFDVVDEDNATWGGGGNDTVKSAISFDLTNPEQVIGTIETLVLTGTANISGFGTGANETIEGNSGNNILNGSFGDDNLSGNGGNDQLFGDLGNDSLVGGDGNDMLYGGAGADFLEGGLGDDLMFGGAGRDTYLVYDLGDVVDEAVTGSNGIDKIVTFASFFDLADSDQVKGAVENLELVYGNSGWGNSLKNVMVGNAGKNSLDGKLGNDVLTGGGEADRFLFTTALNAAKNRDKITDFVHGTDKIVLENAIFTSLAKKGGLPTANFAINNPGDANDFIVYNTTNGILSYDADGNGAGAGIPFVTLTGVPGLTQADVVVI